MIPNIVPKTIKIVHSNILVLLDSLWQWKNHMILCMSLSPNVHLILKDSLSYKVVLIQYRRIIRRHFYQLTMNSYLHQNNITLTKYHMMYPIKKKDLCNYDHNCIMSSDLMLDDIIVDIIRNNKFPHPNEENDCLFT